jgi:hypothetical protein
MSLARPNADEFGPFGKYISLVPDGDIVAILEIQLQEILDLLRPLPEPVSLEQHPPYTWSIREVVGHVTDCERVFAYRTLRLARGDPTPLPSFDENLFARQARFDRWLLADLVISRRFARRRWDWCGESTRRPGGTRAS